MILGRKVGAGLRADVYEWGDGADRLPKVLKLFKEGRSRAGVEWELEFSRAASEAGIPTPGVYGEIVERDGRFGITYERIEAQSLMLLLPDVLFRTRSYARTLADLHFRAHGAEVSGLRTQKEHLKYKIERARTITEGEKSRLKDLTDSMPDGDSLCHNDFHPGNVIYRTPEEQGPVIIDWENAAVGDPTADVAQTRLLATFGWRRFPNGPVRWVLRRFIDRFYRFYSHRYFELSEVNAPGVDRWMTVMAAARIDDDIPEEHEPLVRYVRERLALGL